MGMSQEQLAHIGALIYAAEENALAAHDLLTAQEINPLNDDQRIALTQARALTAFAFAFTAFVQATPMPVTEEPAPEPTPEPTPEP